MNQSIDPAACKERYEQLLSSVERKGLPALLSWLNTTDFFTAPASMRYHGDVEGGLCAHSLCVYDELVRLNALYGSPIEDASMIIAALLHDLCKIFTYAPDTRRSRQPDGRWIDVPGYRYEDKVPLGHHGAKSVMLVRNFIRLTDLEQMMIVWHMGGFVSQDEKRTLSDAMRMYPPIALMHMADLAAAYILGI